MFMKKIKAFINFVYLLIKNPGRRLNISLIFGIFVNLIYLGGNFLSAVVYRSPWAISVIAYHVIFLLMRLYLVYSGRNSPSERKPDSICLFIGVLLFVLDFLALAIIMLTISDIGRVRYSGFLLFFFLCYAIYSLASSLLGMKKWKNDNNILHFTAKNLSFASALMSVFNLQFSVFSSLNVDSALGERLIYLGGFSVFVLILALSFRLIVKGRSTFTR